jgi:hypothetical protein
MLITFAEYGLVARLAVAAIAAALIWLAIAGLLL